MQFSRSRYKYKTGPTIWDSDVLSLSARTTLALTPFYKIRSFYTPGKHQKTKDFRVFSREYKMLKLTRNGLTLNSSFIFALLSIIVPFSKGLQIFLLKSFSCCAFTFVDITLSPFQYWTTLSGYCSEITVQKHIQDPVKYLWWNFTRYFCRKGSIKYINQGANYTAGMVCQCNQLLYINTSHSWQRVP